MDLTEELDRRRLERVDATRDCPAAFHRHILGRPALYPRQAEIARSLAANRVTVVPGAHSVGKSWSAASLVLWYLFTRRPSKVVITSPSYAQLIGVMWEAIRSCYLRSRVSLGPTRAILHQSLHLAPEHYAVALSTTEPERLQGHHGPNVMVLTDESSLIKDAIWEAIESLGYDRLLVLGNPIRSTGRFKEYYRKARQGAPGFAAVHLTAFDSPHATLTDEEIRARKLPRGLTSKTWIDSVRLMYGEGSTYWRTRVLAEFPEADDLAVFPEAWLAACGLAEPPAEPGRSRWISCDLAGGMGRDRSAILVRDESRVYSLESSAEWGLKECAARVADLKRLHRVPAGNILYDATGLGLGFDAHLALFGIEGATPFKGGEAGGPEWSNLRTAAAMSARERLNPALANHRPFAIPPLILAQLAPELAELKLVPDRDDPKKQRLEPKEDLKARLGRSPDLGDVFTMSFAMGSDLPSPIVRPDPTSPEPEPEPEPEVLTSDQLTLRMAGLL